MIERGPKPRPSFEYHFADMDVGDTRESILLVPDPDAESPYPVRLSVRHEGGQLIATIKYPVGGDPVEYPLDEVAQHLAEYFEVPVADVERAEIFPDPYKEEKELRAELKGSEEVSQPTAGLIKGGAAAERMREREGPPEFLNRLERRDTGWRWVSVPLRHKQDILTRRGQSEADLREQNELFEDTGYVAIPLNEEMRSQLLRELEVGTELYLGTRLHHVVAVDGEKRFALGAADTESRSAETEGEEEPRAGDAFPGEQRTARRLVIERRTTAKGREVTVEKRKIGPKKGPRKTR